MNTLLLSVITVGAVTIAAAVNKKKKTEPEDKGAAEVAEATQTPPAAAPDESDSYAGGPLYDDPSSKIEEDLKNREIDENRMLAQLCAKFFDSVYREPANEDTIALDSVVVSERIVPTISRELDRIQSGISGPYRPTPGHRSRILLAVLNSIAPGCKWDLTNGVRFANGLPISGKMERVYQDIEILVDRALDEASE